MQGGRPKRMRDVMCSSIGVVALCSCSASKTCWALCKALDPVVRPLQVKSGYSESQGGLPDLVIPSAGPKKNMFWPL